MDKQNKPSLAFGENKTRRGKEGATMMKPTPSPKQVPNNSTPEHTSINCLTMPINVSRLRSSMVLSLTLPGSTSVNARVVDEGEIEQRD